MATTSTSTAVAAIEPMFTEPERLALAGFLAGYTGLTRLPGLAAGQRRRGASVDATNCYRRRQEV